MVGRPTPHRRAAAAAISLTTTMLVAASAHAAQFVVADVSYTHSSMHTDSHNRVNPTPETPANWTSPVDYATGSAHVRLEVKTKPNTTTPTCFQVCFEAATNYGCTDISMPYTNVGVYEWTTPFSRFYTPGPVSWSTGVRRVALILKNTTNGKPSPENVGAATSALYMPTDVRLTVTIVSAGSTYQPPAGSAVDGGSGGAADAARPTVDAARSDGASANNRDAASADASRSTDASTGVSEAAAPTTERPPVMEAAAPAPTPTTPPATGQGGSGGSGGAGGSAAAGGASPSPTPSAAPSSSPPTPSEPEGGASCSVVRFPGSHSSNLKMLAGAVALVLAASRRRRVIAPRAKRKACQ